ncbi:hypothetical protein VC218_07240 [Xanthomonas nasturtii]|uniref:hypothetical protein n=1 Tax=Xanthomonas nasturtii TaxID=1843581 RepID=UPI002B22CE75|nr:hypothetical protein [Xanthomonas nasturtii]MEA9578716.1 hypothetical protein [Xanthomonas nasturtii]
MLPALKVLLTVLSGAAMCSVAAAHAVTRDMSPKCDEAQALTEGTALCTAQHGLLKLTYERASGRIVVQAPTARKNVLETIPHPYDPARVGAENLIRWLPMKLQPYLAHGKLLYFSARRSSPGDGHGYCGAGAEISVTVVNLRPVPKVEGHVPVSSCLDNIELAASSGSDLSPYTVRNGKLTIAFSAYPGRGHVVAQINDDLTGLDFLASP